MSNNNQQKRTLLFMEKQLYNLKFTSTRMKTEHSRMQKGLRVDKIKLKKAIEQKNEEEAKIHAETMIRKKNEATNYLRLSHRIDSVASKVESAIRMKTITASMQNVVGCLSKIMNTSDVSQIESIMDKFSEQMEQMDTKLGQFESVVNKATQSVTPENQVDDLIKQVADEYQLEVFSSMKTTSGIKNPVSDPVVKEDNFEDLFSRLEDLRCS